MAQQQRRRSGGTGPAASPGSRARPRAAADRPRAGGDLAVERARVREIVAPLLEAAGYDLEDLAVSRVGRRHLVRVVVDGDDGVSLETIADLSREISAALDAAESAAGEFMAHEYQLEVSSPGVGGSSPCSCETPLLRPPRRRTGWPTPRRCRALDSLAG